MEKGSPEGYDAETGLAQPAQKPQTGEPNERHSLYRIRCPQEKRQLLREDRRWSDRRRRQAASYAPGAAPVGAATHRTVARRHGSDAVQRLALRCVEAVCGRVADGAPGHDESHRGVQEKERPAGRTQNRRSGALQFAAGVLRSAGGDPGTAALTALPQCGGGAGGAHEEQDERPADGGGRAVQQAATARQAVLQRVARPVGRSARVGERSTAAEPDHAGSVRSDTAAVAGETAARSAVDGTGEVVDRDSWRGHSDGVDLGAGSRRAAAVFFHRACGELLRTHLGAGSLGRQTAARANLQTTQRTLADGIDRGGKAGAALESAVGRGTRARTGGRPSQPGHSGGGAETGGISAGGGQIRPAIQSPGRGCTGGRNSGVNTGSELTSRIICDPTQAARRSTPDGATVLAVKGSLRRANARRALDRCGPLRLTYNHDGRLRRDHNQTRLRAAPQRFTADPPAVPRLNGDCTREAFLLMCHSVCFEAGRLTLTQSSQTALGRSRKWMSGPGDSWTLFVTDRPPHIVSLLFRLVIALRQTLPPSAGRTLLSLDRPLSWMSPYRQLFLLVVAGIAGAAH